MSQNEDRKNDFSGKQETEKHFKAGKTFRLIMSVLIAVVLWGYVIGEINPVTSETISDVSVRLLNADDLEERGLAIEGTGDYLVDVVIEGKRSDVKDITAADVLATADLAGFGEGENYVRVNVTVPPAVSVVDIKSPKICVVIESLSKVSMPVEINMEGSFGDGKELGAIVIQPQEVVISGAVSDVREADKVRVTVKAEAFSEDEERTVQGTVDVLNEEGVPMDTVNLSAQVADVTGKIMDVKSVPLKIEMDEESVEPGIFVDAPKTIKVCGESTALAQVFFVSVRPVGLDSAVEGDTVVLEADLPQGVELSSENPELTGTVFAEETMSRTLELTEEDLSVSGLGEGLHAEIQSTDMAVTVFGAVSVIDDIKADDIVVTADVSGLGAGTHEVPLRVFCSKATHSITIEPQTVTVTIQ